MINTDDFIKVYMDTYGIPTKKQAKEEITRVLDCIDDTAKANGGLVFRNFRFKVKVRKAYIAHRLDGGGTVPVKEKHFLTYTSQFDPEAVK